MPFPTFNSLSSLAPIFLFVSLLLSIAMADSSSAPASGVTPSSSAAESAVQIVYTEQPPANEDPEAFHLRTLASVLGSEAAAKEALVYSYKTAASGFSAKLTPEQVSQISKQPGVLQVVPSRKLELHSAKGMMY